MGIWIGFGLSHKSQVKTAHAPIVPIAEAMPSRMIAAPPSESTPSRMTASLTTALPQTELAAIPISKPQTAPFPFFPKRPPRIAFVIDDFGYNNHYTDLLFSIHPPITIAILPQLTYSRFYAAEGKKRGFETLLHLPLEPDDFSQHPGAGEITTTMDSDQVEQILAADLITVPGVSGVNNHMGSRATRDLKLMETVLKKLKREKLFFLDSLTSMNSVAYGVARSLKLETFKRDVFLDNVDEIEYIRRRIEETAEAAEKNGHAVAIGHVRENTLRAIKEAIPGLEARGFKIVPLKDLS